MMHRTESRTHRVGISRWVGMGLGLGLAGLLTGCGQLAAWTSAPALHEAHPSNDNKYSGGVSAKIVLSPTHLLKPAIPVAVRRDVPNFVVQGLSTGLPHLTSSSTGAARQIFGPQQSFPWYYQGTTTRNNPVLLMVDTIRHLAYPSRFRGIREDILRGAGTTFNSSNPVTINQELHGNIAEQDPGFQSLYIPTLFTETMGLKSFQQSDPHEIDVVAVGTQYTVPVYSVKSHGPVLYTAFHAYSPQQSLAPKVMLPAGYQLQEGPGTILVGQPISDVVFRDGNLWALGKIQWTIIEAFTNRGWFVVTFDVNPVPKNLGATAVPSSQDVEAHILP